MKVKYDEKSGTVVVIFTLKDSPTAKQVFLKAIELYREAGADVSEIESLMWIFNETTLQ